MATTKDGITWNESNNWEEQFKIKEMKKHKIKIEWGTRQMMSSLIVLLRDGNYENQNYASERLMELADQIDDLVEKSEKVIERHNTKN